MKCNANQFHHHASQLWEEALAEADEGWLEAPFPCTGSDGLLVNGRKVAVSAAYRFGAQQADMITAGSDVKRSSTDSATNAHSLINLPSRGHSAQHLRSVQI